MTGTVGFREQGSDENKGVTHSIEAVIIVRQIAQYHDGSRCTMKKTILTSIYRNFDSWAGQFSLGCRKGCAACCTQDVTATAVESELVIDYISGNQMESWLVERLDRDLPRMTPSSTTNEYAHDCLEGIERDPETAANGGICPFLEEGECSIYPVRPFSCRSFASTVPCRPGNSAVIFPYYLTAVTAVSQIIEHLSQRYFWGNMLHVVYLLAQQNSSTQDTKYPENRKRLLQAQTSCLTSKPLPGFLISREDCPYVEPLIKKIFAARIGGRSVEDILNNR